MAIIEDVLSTIDTFVRGGFEQPDRILEIICDEIYEGEALDRDEVNAEIRRLLRELRRSKSHWPAVTDCDKLNTAFDALNARGVIAIQNAGLTQNDGHDDVMESYRRHPDKASVAGYCFYHGQDLARAVKGAGLYIAFGPIDPDKEAQEGPRVGAMVVECLAEQGLTCNWNGTFTQRIHVPELDWKRR